MASSLFLWTSTKDKETGDQKSNSVDDLETKPEIARSRSKRSSKSNGQKKLPQRGLGVAQLERLRLQERWKKITEIDQAPPQHHQFQFPFPFVQQHQSTGASLPRYGPPLYGGGASIEAASASRPLTPACVVQKYRFGNGGFPAAAGGISAVRSVFPEQQYTVDRFRIAAYESRFQGGNAVETVKELSSIQKMQCLSDHCEFCVKKKRVHGENLGFNGRSCKLEEMAAIEGCDFLGLKLGSSRTVDEEINDFGLRGGEIRPHSSAIHVRPELEVVGVQRKGKWVGQSELMEYEFFPEKGNHNNFNGPEATGAGASSSSNILDLSLKLSW